MLHVGLKSGEKLEAPPLDKEILRFSSYLYDSFFSTEDEAFILLNGLIVRKNSIEYIHIKER
ncbi:hypothetical protein DCC39_10380 [Pueribacillus theae]|uniref:Uncharacterized protein n=1 Tax=Pueribacillus theae TaxID=2171751 RepID=A0A2U1K0R5_9BACI|nr:hypothetical protein [Pueribacillus theae]PWA11096.1 hypothetical protein DCC39_10380 [Pueribacillus theae]